MGAVIEVAIEVSTELAPDVVYIGDSSYVVAWHVKGESSDIYGRAVAADGSSVGDSYPIAGESENGQNPRLVKGGSSGTLALWERDNGDSTGRDLYGIRGDNLLRTSIGA